MPKTHSWKKTGERSLRVYCMCGAVHEVKSDKEGNIEVEHFNSSVALPSAPPVKKKSSMFDPLAEDDGEGEED